MNMQLDRISNKIALSFLYGSRFEGFGFQPSLGRPIGISGGGCTNSGFASLEQLQGLYPFPFNPLKPRLQLWHLLTI